MADGAPISQEIRLPTDTEGLTSAASKLDAIIARVDKLEHSTDRHERRSESAHNKERRNQRESEHGWEGVGRSIEGAKNKAHEFFEFIGAVAAFEVLEKIVDKFIEIGKEAVHTAAAAERMNFAIDAAAGGKEEGERTRHWLDANAKHSEFGDNQNKAAYLMLKRYGVGQQKAGLFMKGAEDLAAVSDPGQREAVYQEALSAFARVHARGKIDTRSAMRLGIGVEDFATLPQFQGKSRKQISKALQTDTANVSENDLLNLIMHRTGEKAIGQRAFEASELLLTRLAKLKELPEQFFQKLGETSAVKKLATEIGVALEKLDPESPNGKKIFAALEKTFDTIAEVVHEIDFDAVADTISEDVLPALAMMGKMLGAMLEPIERVIRGLHRIKNIFSDNSSLEEGPAVAARRAERREANKVAEAFPEKKVDVGKGATATHGAFHLVGESNGEGYAEGVDASTPDAEASSKHLGKRSKEALKTSIDAHSPSRLTEEVGGDFGEGYARGIEQSSRRVEDAMDSTMRVPAAGYAGGASVAGLGAGVSVTFAEGSIQIVVAGAGDPGDTAAAVRDELAKSIRPMLVDILEETRGEG